MGAERGGRLGPWREELRQLRHEADVALGERRHVLVSEDPPPIEGRSLLFLGSGGNPTNVVGQMRQTGGFVVTLPGCRVFVDPGPGAIFHAARAGVEMRNLTALFISHEHTDHASGAGAVIEAMCRGMSARRGSLLAPREVLDAIPPFYRGEVARPPYPGGTGSIVPLTAGCSVGIAPGVSLTATPAHHGGANVGMRLDDGTMRVSYTSDTAFITRFSTEDGREHEVERGVPLPEDLAQVTGVYEDVVEAHRDADVLIMNVSFLHLFPHRQLTAIGAIELIRRARPKRAVLTHFDPSLGIPPERAENLARIVGEITSTPTTAASDGLLLPLAEGA